MKTILMTGAAGRIGTFLRPELAGKYRLRLSDVKPIRDLRPGGSFVRADIYRGAAIAWPRAEREAPSRARPRPQSPASGAGHENRARARCGRIGVTSFTSSSGANRRNSRRSSPKRD
jgi:hypothetical protein